MGKVLKSLFAVLLVFVLSSQLFAVDGTVTYVKGKVEVQRGGDWTSLKVGDKVSQSETISTGFQSEAKVKLMESVLYLGPVTRVTLDQLATTSDRDKVNVYLSAGTVRSKVNRTDDKRVNYTVRTPIAVASVRGTDVEVNAAGDCKTYSGLVAYSTAQDLGMTPEEFAAYAADKESEDKESKDKDGKTSSDSNEVASASSEAKSGSDKESSSDTESGSDKEASSDMKSGSDKQSGSDKAAGSNKASGSNKQSSSNKRESYRSERQAKMEDSDGLASEVMVSANHTASYNTVSNFGKSLSNVTGGAMNIIQSVSTQSSKTSVNKGAAKSPAATVTGAIVGETVSVPKTGSIKVNIKEPSTGNVSVEVVIPQ